MGHHSGHAVANDTDATAEERVAQRVRDEILTLVLSDIQRPIHEISFHAGILERAAAGPSIEKVLLSETAQDIRHALFHVQALLGGIQAGERGGDTEASLNRCPYNLSWLLAVVVHATQPLVTARRVHLVAEAQGVADLVKCDRVRMIPALVALLVEAVRRTPAGERVRVLVTHDEAMHFTVQDGGVHLDGEQIAQFLAQPTSDRDTPHLLRVSEARRVIELHGGSLRMRPEPTGGMVLDAIVPSR